ncbi:MAG: DUF1003 domain-containing protein [Acidobacteria bacterium]|nr:DUF1003 domain-containing protein [Acidobacteriota bacterium]
MELVVSAVGSPRFVELNLLWIGSWLIINFGLIPGINPFDPFPFSLLMLILPIEALMLVLLTGLNRFHIRRVDMLPDLSTSR